MELDERIRAEETYYLYAYEDDQQEKHDSNQDPKKRREFKKLEIM